MAAVCLHHTRKDPSGKGTSWAVVRVERGSDAHHGLLAGGWTYTTKAKWRRYKKAEKQ